MRVLFSVVMLAMILSISAGCNRNKVFKSSYKFENNTWKRIGEDIQFDVEINDAGKKYDIDIPIRHAIFYPYQYLEISFNVLSPSGEEGYYTKKIYLKERDGKWKGSGMGDIWDYTYRIFEAYTFNEEGVYTIEFQNLTGNNMFLPGIMEIGLEITKTK